MADRERQDNGGRNGGKEAGGVQALSRGLTLLILLSESEQGLTLTEMSHRTGLAASTTHRLLRGLEAMGFAEQSGDPSRWRVGVTAFSVGNAFARARSVVATARPAMQALMETADETVNLAVEEQGNAVYLAQVEGRQLMRAFSRPGSRVLLHCSGVGKALLMGAGRDRASRWVSEKPLTRLTEKTLTDLEALLSDLDTARPRGFVIDDEEHAVGLRCVAAPVYNEVSEPMAALSISGPAARIDDARLADLGRMVAETAAEVTATLGGIVPEGGFR